MGWANRGGVEEES